ncbi:MAG: aminotransferase class IV [Pyrinomonadaceae bacterium]
MMQTSNASLYGKGIFTTIAIRDGEAFLWEKHWRRLTDNAVRVGIDLTEHTEQSTRDALDDAIATSGFADGRARITFSDESSSELWSNDVERRTTLSIIVAERRVVPEPFRLTVSPYPVNSRSPLAGVKSYNYLENILALGEAKARGFDEAVRVNELGSVTCAAMANIFWSKDGQLFTPSLTTGCLAGTTREYVLENFACREVAAEIDVLAEADAIFLTSAGIGVVAVAEFEGRSLVRAHHAITELLSAARDAG